MAQRSVPNPLHDARSLTWSPLPPVCFTIGYSTESESTSGFKMVQEQLLDWKDFEAAVRLNANASLGSQTQSIPTQTEREVVHVGNEQGLMGRFGQNIGHVMSEVNRMCGLPIYYADYQVGQNTIERRGHRNVPDLILMDDQYVIRAVGEGKTFWTKDLAAVGRPILAVWLGQLARYMDDLRVRYGFYTTYNVTVFLRRASDTIFEVSPPILHNTTSTESGGKDGVSVRECFLYFVKLASLDSYNYPNTYGKILTDGSLGPRERSSQRIEEQMANLNLKNT